jgi:hypothetical protein
MPLTTVLRPMAFTFVVLQYYSDLLILSRRKVSTSPKESESSKVVPNNLLMSTLSVQVMSSVLVHSGLGLRFATFQYPLDLSQLRTNPDPSQNVSRVRIVPRTDLSSPSKVSKVSSAYWTMTCCLSPIGSLIPFTTYVATSLLSMAFITFATMRKR